VRMRNQHQGGGRGGGGGGLHPPPPPLHQQPPPMRDIAPTRMNDVNLSDAGGMLGGRPGMRGRGALGAGRGSTGDLSEGGSWRTVGSRAGASGDANAA
jgi:hypothetical protein